MSNLKTLNETEGFKTDNLSPEQKVATAELRLNLKQEAIKWIKKIRGSLDIKMCPEAYMHFLNEANLFALFFNITEENLK